MKQYDRIQKKYVEVVDKPVGSLKRPETCKGKKPHDWVLMIPKHVSTRRTLYKEEIAEYYKIKEDHAQADRDFGERYDKIGVNMRYYYGESYRFYKCAVCGKEKTEFLKK